MGPAGRGHAWRIRHAWGHMWHVGRHAWPSPGPVPVAAAAGAGDLPQEQHLRLRGGRQRPQGTRRGTRGGRV